MNFAALGISVTSNRDAGSLFQYSFGLPEGSEREALSELLTTMSEGSELSFPDPTIGDCYLEAKRKGVGYEIKHGCHGSYGTWRAATLAEAHAWLLPGAMASLRLARPGFGAMLVVPKVGK
jgi:hypothetical protein